MDKGTSKKKIKENLDRSSEELDTCLYETSSSRDLLKYHYENTKCSGKVFDGRVNKEEKEDRHIDLDCECNLPERSVLKNIVCKVREINKDLSFYLVQWEDLDTISQICTKDFRKSDIEIPNCIDASCLDNDVIWKIIEKYGYIDIIQDKLLVEIMIQFGKVESILVKLKDPEENVFKFLVRMFYKHSKFTEHIVITEDILNSLDEHYNTDEVLDCSVLNSLLLDDLWIDSNRDEQKFIQACKDEIYDTNLLNTFGENKKVKINFVKKKQTSPLRNRLPQSPRKKRKTSPSPQSIINKVYILFYCFCYYINY